MRARVVAQLLQRWHFVGSSYPKEMIHTFLPVKCRGGGEGREGALVPCTADFTWK